MSSFPRFSISDTAHILLFLFASPLIASDPLLLPEYNPTYMIAQGAYYGGFQNDYISRAQGIISKTKKAIETAAKNREDLSNLFFELLDTMANERRQIATDHQTERAQEFGLRRDHEIASVSYTRLNRPGYTHYGKEAIVYLNKILAQMEYSKQDFLQKKHFFIDSALGRSSLVEITILDKEDLEKQGWFTTPLDQKVPKWFPKELWYTQRRSVDQHKEFYLALKRFWEEDLQEYEWLEKENHIRLFYSVVPPHHNKLKLIKTHAPVRWIDQFLSPKTLLVELTVSFEINGKLRPLYGYFTALYRDEDSSSEDLLKRMESHSPPLLIHQRQFLIEETLNDAASVFGQIVRWKGDDLNELKQLMALFRFQMSCMPFYRGSSAITEWLEAALYNYHRVSYKFDPSRQIDLEVYSHPLFSDFIKAYDSICTLSLKE